MDTQKRIILWVSTALVVGVTGIGAWQVAKAPPKVPLPARTEGTLAEPVGPNEWTKGAKGAKVSLVEYSDFQCPACGSYYPTVEKITAEYADKMSFTYRHFPFPPLQHPHAERMAYAAEAAGKQGKFWEMYKLIFDHQQEWSKTTPAQVAETVLGYATELKLDLDLFKKDMESPEMHAQVKRTKEVGIRSGVAGTPTFYLNGKKLQPTPYGYEEFKAIIDKELAK